MIKSLSLVSISSPIEDVLLICEKCGKKQISQEGETNPAIVIQQDLKLRIRATLPAGTARAVLTGCLSVCPDNAISVAHINIGSSPDFYLLPKSSSQAASNLLYQTFFLKHVK